MSIGSALKQAAHKGVAINILLDGFGCKDMPKTYLSELENVGVQVLFYRPKISPWTLKKNRLRRMHRKIAVVDNKIDFVGGINIIDAAHKGNFVINHRNCAVHAAQSILF